MEVEEEQKRETSFLHHHELSSRRILDCEDVVGIDHYYYQQLML